jgi:hypothetical protein
LLSLNRSLSGFCSLFGFLPPGAGASVSVTEEFDPVNSIGLFELQWDLSAPIGTVNSGTLS